MTIYTLKGIFVFLFSFFVVCFFSFYIMAPRHETAGRGVCDAVSECELVMCVSELVWCVCVCVFVGVVFVLVGEGGVVPLQLLLSARPLLVLRLAALLVFAAL